MNKWFKSGTPWIWMTGGAVSLSLIMVIGLFLLIGWRGLSFFWPATVYEFDMVDKQGNHMNVIGEIYDTETVLKQQLIDAGITGLEDKADTLERYLIKVGNREYVDLDFQWILETIIIEKEIPNNVVVLERTKNGNFYGYIKAIQENGNLLTLTETQLESELAERLAITRELKNSESDLLKGDIGRINFDLERIRLNKRKLDLDGQLTQAKISQLEEQSQSLRDEYLTLEKQLFEFRTQAQRDTVVITDMSGRDVVMPIATILDFYLPNKMSFFEKVQHWFHQTAKFVSDDPREANTEGGVFPAIFGTVFMVMLMAVIVTPFGVIAAIYLHEYAP
ncbi:MAG: phosphate ABC transporter, permease protein PstA, partial [Psychromonas sp.]|nr:phosphate ABC transporter, permease protein PstA [Psychromonas sp.]